MYNNRKMIIYSAMLTAGIVLIVLCGIGLIDEYWSGFGGGIVGVAVVRLFLGKKYKNDEEYAKRVKIAQKDERIAFIAGKAKSWTFSILIYLLAIASIVFFAMKNDFYSHLFSYALCVVVVIYWVCYMIINKKY